MVTEPTFKVGNDYLTQISPVELWSYLGVNFEGSKVVGGQASLAADIEMIGRAPLKPQQRLHILRTYAIPKYYHAWVLGRVSAGYLKKQDIQIRQAVRRWLHLPHDTPVGYFHAPHRSGGLSFPMLGHVIPMLRLRRFEKLLESPIGYIRACARSDFMRSKIEWCRQRLARVVDGVATPESLRRVWTETLHRSVDGKGLVGSEKCPCSTAWLADPTTQVPAAEWVQNHLVHINALPARARTTRGREHLDNTCRAGCRAVETPAHAIQVCFRSHSSRVQRHDAMVDRLGTYLTQGGWEVHKELTFETAVGKRKPDIVAIRGDSVAVVDAQIVAISALQHGHRDKVTKYRDEARLDRYVPARMGLHRKIATIDYASLTLSWRGVWSRESADSLRALGVTARQMRRLTTMALQGSWRCWRRFNATTACRRGGDNSD